MKREYYNEEMMLKETIISQKSDQEIGMPDVEAELKRVKLMANKKTHLLSGWRRVAAICTLVISLSGLTWAVVTLQQHHAEVAKADPQQSSMCDDNKAFTQDSEVLEVNISEQMTLSYDKATLEQIVTDLTAYYHLEQPVFENKEAACKYKMHITLNPEATIEEAVALLNKFGSIRVELADNKLVVK